jgi:hypothetical protein
MTSDLARWLCLCLCLAAGCADLSRGPAPAETTPSADAGADSASDVAALSFASPVHGLLTAGCQGCHAQGQQAGDTQYLLTGDPASDYSIVSLFIDLGAPARSRLLAKMSGNGHGGGTVYGASTPEYAQILQWIQQGAPP